MNEHERKLTMEILSEAEGYAIKHSTELIEALLKALENITGTLDRIQIAMLIAGIVKEDYEVSRSNFVRDNREVFRKIIQKLEEMK